MTLSCYKVTKCFVIDSKLETVTSCTFFDELQPITAGVRFVAYGVIDITSCIIYYTEILVIVVEKA